MAKRRGRPPKKRQISEPTSPSDIEPTSTEPRRTSLPVPADVVLEICRHSHPLDVLHLARTCKALRDVLRDRSSITAWKQAFRNTGLPPCPDDIAAPHYAAMFYEFVCDRCGTSRCKKARRDVHWDLRARLCVKCVRKFLVSVPKQCPGLPVDSRLQDLVPTSHLETSFGRTFEPILRKTMDEIQSLVGSELAAYVNKMKDKLSTIYDHSRVAEQWDEEETTKLINDEDIAIRQATVLSRLQNEGWGEQLDIYRDKVLSHPLVNQSKQLFDDDWEIYKQRIREDAKAEWTAAHEARLLKRRKQARYRRWVLAMEVLDDFEDDEAYSDGQVWPDGNDLRRMPELQPMLNGVEPTEADATALLADSDSSSFLKSADARVYSMTVEIAVPVTLAPVSHHEAMALTSDSTENFILQSSDRDDDDDDDDDGYDDEYDLDDYLERMQSDSEESILPPRSAAAYDYLADSSSSDSDSEQGGSASSNDEDLPAISDSMTRLFSSALTTWRQRISLQLFRSIPRRTVRALVGDIDTSSDAAKIAFLSRAATVFECRGQPEIHDSWACCGASHTGYPKPLFSGPLLFYPDALKHRLVCALPELERMEHFEARTKYHEFDNQVDLRIAWSPSLLVLSKDASKFMQVLVQASGLDHRTATQRDLDEVDARFVCKTCVDTVGVPTPGPTGKNAVQVHNWLSCLHDTFSRDGHCGRHHPACFVRLTNVGAEARAREIAPRKDDHEPVNAPFSELGFSRESLFS